MNYGAGGAGQYGQPPMGGMGQMHPQMMQQQRMQMMQQQNAAAAAAAGMRMPPGMYHPMHGGQHMMQGQMAAYPTNSAMIAAQQHRMNEISKSFPSEWKQNILQEKNEARRKMLFEGYAKQMQHMQRQNMMGGAMGMGASGMMPPGSHNGMGMFGPSGAGPGMPGMPGMQGKGMMSNAAAMQLRMQQHHQQQLQQHGGMVGQVGMHGSGIGPQVKIEAVQSQNMPNGSPAPLIPVPGQLGVHGSPQVAAQPATPQNPSSVEPGSVPEKKPASVLADLPPEYINLMTDLRGKNLELLKRIGERCRLDNMPMPKGYVQLMEILSERRSVDTQLMQRVIKSAVHLLERASLSFPIMDEIKRAAHDEQKRANIVSPPKNGRADPWDGVRHLFIRVPDDVLRIVETPIPSPGSKRPANGDENGVAPPKIRKIDGKPVKQEPVDEETPKVDVNRIEIECMFGKGKKWQMSEAASQELDGIPWRLDPDTVPPSWRSPDVTVCFDAKILLVPPLRVMIPSTYPADPPVVLFDRSFPMGKQLSSQLATLFERRLSLSPGTRSITCIYESFKGACQELIRMKNLTVLEDPDKPSETEQESSEAVGSVITLDADDTITASSDDDDDDDSQSSFSSSSPPPPSSPSPASSPDAFFSSPFA